MPRKTDRTLIRHDALEEAIHLKQLGVPVSVIMRDLKLTMTQPTFSKLLGYWSNYLVNHPGNNSLTPPWLLSSGPIEQTAPLGWEYTGMFPFGEWSTLFEATPKDAT